MNDINVQAFSTSNETPNSPAKIAKSIEIIVRGQVTSDTGLLGVGFEFDDKLICSILSDVYQPVRITVIDSPYDLQQLVARKPDLVFSGIKYFDFAGQQMWLSDYLDQHNIAYITSSKKALNGEYDKSNAKLLVREAGLTTANYFTTAPGEHATAASIPIQFPVFVKPLTGGDSKGVDADSVVNNFASFQLKVADIWSNQLSRSLVETYLSGREYSVGIFHNSMSGTMTAMPIEIIAQKNKNGQRVLDFDTKRLDNEEVIAVSDPIIHKQLSDLAKQAFRALNGKSIGRIDIKMNEQNIPHFIEANLVPGLRKGYFYRCCALNLNMRYAEMILNIAHNALAENTSEAMQPSK